MEFMEIGAERKVKFLLNAIGAQAYTILRSLRDAVLPAKRTYAELCSALSKYYMPPVLTFKQRRAF